jgi:hypothetical protein
MWADSVYSNPLLVVAALAVFVGPVISWYAAKRQLTSSLAVANKQIVAPMRQAWIKEVPQLTKMALQNESGFKSSYRTCNRRLRDDPPLNLLAKHRDFVVHRGMLRLKSGGTLGITEGRGIKLGFSIPIHPLEDSDAAMERYLHVVDEKGDFFGLLQEDEDSLPCVQREWRLPDLDEEIVEACATAWLRTGEAIDGVLRWLGAEPPPLSLDCRHSGQQVRSRCMTAKSSGLVSLRSTRQEPLSRANAGKHVSHRRHLAVARAAARCPAVLILFDISSRAWRGEALKRVSLTPGLVRLADAVLIDILPRGATLLRRFVEEARRAAAQPIPLASVLAARLPSFWTPSCLAFWPRSGLATRPGMF